MVSDEHSRKRKQTYFVFVRIVESKPGNNDMGFVVRKPVFRVSDKVSSNQCPQLQRLARKLKIEISLVASLDMILSNKQITKALIRLCGCAGWSAPLLFANSQIQVFSRRGPYDDEIP